MDTLWKDLKFAARMLLGSPGFTVVATLTLALGIGANSAIFSVINSLLLRPLPFEEADRLVFLQESSKQFDRMSVSYPNFMDWRDQNSVFELVAAHRLSNFNLTGTDRPERLLAALVSASLFPLLRVEPLVDRGFLEEEDQPGAERVVLLSYGLWQRRFGSNPEVVGQPLSLDGESYMVVGVTPPGFQYPLGNRDPEIYLPIGRFSEEWQKSRGSHPGIAVTARLKRGVSLEQARADMDTIAKRLEREYPDSNTGHTVRVDWLHERLVREVRPALMVLLAAVALVLLIACANVASLLLASASARLQEIAVRTALGAERFRLVRQLLTESVLLSLVGGILGVAIAYWGVRALVVSLPEAVPPIYRQIDVDVTVLSFTLLLSLLTGVVFGLAPALQASKPNLSESLKEGGRSSSGGPGSQRFRNGLVVAEVALALVLLVSAGLMMRSFFNVMEEDPGFNPKDVLALDVSLPESNYPGKTQRAAFYRELEQTIKALPGVRSAGLSIPLLGGWQNSYVVEGQPAPAPGENLMTDFLRVNPDYFRTMEIPLLRGRYFTEQDGESTPPVVIIDQSFAERHWPGEDPIGKRVKFGSDPASDNPWLEVVGVVRHVKSYGVDRDSREEIYLSYAQAPERSMTLLVKTDSAPETVAAAVRKEVQNLDPDQPIYNVRTMEQFLADQMTVRRVSFALLSIFAAIALLLAAVGVYGLIAYAVSQRTHEIGIRMAMGAQAKDVLKLVLRHGMRLASIGVGLGLLTTYVVTPLMASLLFGVSARDPMTLAGFALLLATVALTASFIPARRATRVAPVIALRYE